MSLWQSETHWEIASAPPELPLDFMFCFFQELHVLKKCSYIFSKGPWNEQPVQCAHCPQVICAPRLDADIRLLWSPTSEGSTSLGMVWTPGWSLGPTLFSLREVFLLLMPESQKPHHQGFHTFASTFSQALLSKCPVPRAVLAWNTCCAFCPQSQFLSADTLGVVRGNPSLGEGLCVCILAHPMAENELREHCWINQEVQNRMEQTNKIAFCR